MLVAKGKIDQVLTLLDESIVLIEPMKEDTSRYREYMSKALMFK